MKHFMMDDSMEFEMKCSPCDVTMTSLTIFFQRFSLIGSNLMLLRHLSEGWYGILSKKLVCNQLMMIDKYRNCRLNEN